MLTHLLAIQKQWRETLIKHQNNTQATTMVNTKGQFSAEIDVILESKILEYVREHQLPLKMYSEEIGVVTYHPNPKGLLCFDPLDGTTNFRIGKNMLPYGLLMAFYDSPSPVIADVTCALAFEATSESLWTYDGHVTNDTHNQPVTLIKNWELEKSTPVYFDLHASQGYEEYSRLSKQVYIRNTGSTIGNLNYLLSNVAAAVTLKGQKSEEVGALYGLVKGAGGIVVDDQNHEIGSRTIRFDQRYPVLAGHPDFISHLWELVG
jgi:fructose-1,6-bisphosphatase/inositol monophosphatase family enzyme